jgi:hypothetical protein
MQEAFCLNGDLEMANTERMKAVIQSVIKMMMDRVMDKVLVHETSCDKASLRSVGS